MAGHTQHGLAGWLGAVNVLANLFIVFGYVLVPFTVLRYLRLNVTVLLAGTFFFLTCALTHLGMAFGWTEEPWMVLNHAVQAVAVVWFVLSFYFQLRVADQILREAKKLRNGSSGQPGERT